MADKNEEAVNTPDVSDIAAFLPGAEFLPKAMPPAAAEPEEPEEEEGTGAGGNGSGSEDEGAGEPGSEGAGDPEDDAGTEGDDDEEGEEPDRTLPEKVQKRINKLTALRKSAEEARAEAEAKVQEMEGRLAEAAANAAAKAPQPNDPLAGAATLEAIQEKLTEAQKVKAWALANLDGATIPDSNGGEQFIEPEAVRAALNNAVAVLEAGPQKAALLDAQAKDETLAREINPDMYKPGTPAHKMVQDVLRVYPGITRAPDYHSFIADWLAGYTARVAKQKEKQNAAERPPVKLAPPGPKGGAARQVPAKQVLAESAMAHVMKTGGSPDAMAAYFEQTA